MFRDFLALIYPQLCLACERSLYKNEQHICTFCRYSLPKTNFHQVKDNPVARLFWGRVNINSAAAYYSFIKESKVQHLIHRLKYKGQSAVGIFLGKLYGKDLMKVEPFNTCDLVLAVPLHKKKLRKRGYNQSELFAQGLSESMEIRHEENKIDRITATETQTKKSRYMRWENVATVFKVKDPETLKGKHILLVDDVITTGATLEACAQALLKIKDTKVSIAAIAFTGT